MVAQLTIRRFLLFGSFFFFLICHLAYEEKYVFTILRFFHDLGITCFCFCVSAPMSLGNLYELSLSIVRKYEKLKTAQIHKYTYYSSLVDFYIYKLPK